METLSVPNAQRIASQKPTGKAVNAFEDSFVHRGKEFPTIVQVLYVGWGDKSAEIRPVRLL